MKIKRRNLIWGTLFLTAFTCIYLIVVLGFWFLRRDTIYPGISIAGISLSNESDEDIKGILEKEIESYLSGQISIDVNEINLSDLEISYDLEETIKKAKVDTKRNPFLLGFRRNYFLEFSYNSEYSYSYIYLLEKDYSIAPMNSSAKLENEKLKIIDGKSGQQINYADTIYNLQKSLGDLDSKIKLSLIKIPPTYSSSDLFERATEIEEVFLGGLILVSRSEKIEVSLDEMVKWVQLSSKKSSYAEMFGGDSLMLPLVSSNEFKDQLFSLSSIENYLGSLSEELNTEPVNAELKMEGDKVSIFVDSKDGRDLNVSKSAQAIQSNLISGKHQSDLFFEATKPDVHLGSLNDLGIKELIATGYSNFSGSPTNRRHNIRVGAEKFNGLLIKPGETFSLTTNLGNVDAANGYLPELVIKDNETIPEYGGGLCQISSTAFRAALNAGLPITARKAHSYPVTYYKPYGTDATIYIPNPDLKFKNDTESHILIQTRIVGNYLYFDFYGTKVDRIVKFAGNKDASGAVSKAEWVTPYTYDHGGRGEGSFKAVVYRFIYNLSGKLIDSEYFFSNYDSPDKYPH